MQKIKYSCLVLVLLLSGCGYFDRKIAGITGSATHECVGGVQYL